MSTSWIAILRLRCFARLRVSPVEKLSRTPTSWPSAMSRSTTWLPMNPAPPVTRTFELFVIGYRRRIDRRRPGRMPIRSSRGGSTRGHEALGRLEPVEELGHPRLKVDLRGPPEDGPRLVVLAQRLGKVSPVGLLELRLEVGAEALDDLPRHGL